VAVLNEKRNGESTRVAGVGEFVRVAFVRDKGIARGVGGEKPICQWGGTWVVNGGVKGDFIRDWWQFRKVGGGIGRK